MDELTIMPSAFTAGTTVRYTRTLSDYPASTWDLTVYVAGKSKAETDAVADGDDFVVTFAAADTAGLEAGVYTWTERVTDGTDVYDAASGMVLIRPDPEAAVAGDFQSWVSKMAEQLEALLSGRLASDKAEAFQIAGRSVQKIPVSELRQFLAELKADQAIERRGGKIMRDVLVRITGAGFGR